MNKRKIEFTAKEARRSQNALIDLLAATPRHVMSKMFEQYLHDVMQFLRVAEEAAAANE